MVSTHKIEYTGSFGPTIWCTSIRGWWYNFVTKFRLFALRVNGPEVLH